MTGSALMDFLIAVVALCLVVGLIFLAIDRIAPDEGSKKIARWAVGGVALIAFLVAIKGVLFGGGSGLAVTADGLISFAIGLLVLIAVIYIIYMAIDAFAPEPFKVPVKYVVGTIALIGILVLAQQTLFGGGLNVMNLGGGRRHSLLGWSAFA